MRQLRSIAPSDDLFLTPPAYPLAGNQVFRRLKQQLDLLELPGRELTQKAFGQLLGMRRSTVNDWCHSGLAPAIRYFLCALERMPEPTRTGFLRTICRECPRLSDQRFSRDSRALDWLRRIVADPQGLTVLTGASEKARTRVLTAIGNSFPMAASGAQTCGLDLQVPTWFVPVPGLFYLPPEKTRLRKSNIDSVLNRIIASRARLFLFNGLWSAIPESRAKLLNLSRKRNVVIADQPSAYGELQARVRPLHIVHVREAAKGEICLHFEVVREQRPAR